MQSLATKYRPKKFEDVLAQESIITILKRQIETKQIKNCLLFSGLTGSGKTTCARIFANEINKYIGHPIEIDAASNNGVDNVRDIIKSASERSVEGEYKVYVIDEAHTLTSQAWQAFLKCIEEPPEYTIFIFCTTDPQKIPSTILNRVMQFNFCRVDSLKIKQRLEYICYCEGFTNYSETCDYISRIAQGSVRQAISLLDKAASYSTDLKLNNILSAIGVFSYDTMFSLLNNLIDGNEAATLNVINSIYNLGSDLKLFINQFLSFCLDVNKYLLFNSMQMTSLPLSMETNVKKCINFNTAHDYYSYLINKLLCCKNDIKNDTNILSTIEVEMLNICRLI